MENEDDTKMPAELITKKILDLVIKETCTDCNTGSKFGEGEVLQNEELCKKNEIAEELIEENHNTKLPSYKANIESTNDVNVHLSNGKDFEDLNVVNEDVKLPFKEETELTNKKDPGVDKKTQNFEITCEKEDIELTDEDEDAKYTGEKNGTSEMLKENHTTDGNDLEHKDLSKTEEKDFQSLNETIYEKKYVVVCSHCGSDSKISTSSTERESSSYSGSKSGINIEDLYSKEAFKAPSEALVTKIVRQAEFYFSDFNILKNNFLLKHVRRNKEGYVSLKLVASFRKIKSMAKDWRVVAYSLESSQLLEMNSERSKIRRIKPIPKIEETSLGKTVMVFNLPYKNTTSSDLKEMFSKFGNIVHAEIMSPKSDSYNTYHKRCRYMNPELESAVFGCIEFEKFEDAMNAIKDEDSHLPKENRMKVVALIPQFQKPKGRNSRFNQYSRYPRRGNGRFTSRYEFQNDQVVNGISYDDYCYPRPPFNEKQYKRFYRGGYPKTIYPSCPANEVTEKQLGENYLTSGEDLRSNLYTRSRQLKVSNRMNTNRQFVTHQTRYADGNFGYRETKF